VAGYAWQMVIHNDSMPAAMLVELKRVQTLIAEFFRDDQIEQEVSTGRHTGYGTQKPLILESTLQLARGTLALYCRLSMPCDAGKQVHHRTMLFMIVVVVVVLQWQCLTTLLPKRFGGTVEASVPVVS
jgi:hypothetical protein